MAAPYSKDLRRKVVQACERGTHSQREVAELFSVSLSFVESLWRHYRRSGELVPHRQKCGRHPLLDDACREQLGRWLQQQPDLTLQELQARLRADAGVAVSVPTLSRVLCQLGWRLKKRPSMPPNGTRRASAWRGAGTAVGFAITQSNA
jgi:transposase